ncbi:DUF2207 domain-containing protein [Nocardiopsis suaedae]|uniref:DUF2207 domain-containing protein n=1 Tax=Nocardiopsis suaedae TaxID=3018444 RepID=A0ABT4TPI1_9ACTN|nr:DUF2207 domain-containing protein [Nocardiopsis suaedae]MDA2806067.1 DUF2207 domain-containing protein [Nocardiopsis suaedae]
MDFRSWCGGRRSARTAVAVGAVVLLAGGPSAAASAAVGGERVVTAFDADISVTSDGVVEIREEITYDLGEGPGGQVHREIPAAGSIDGQDAGEFGLAGVRVEDSGGVIATDVREGEERTEVTIGRSGTDPALEGEKTFVIAYEYRDVLIADDRERPRLFLDVVGSGWEVPVESVRARVDVPGQAASARCYAGEPGTRDGCADVRRDGGRVTFTGDRVEPGQAFTVDVSVADGDIPVPESAGGGSGSEEMSARDLILVVVVTVAVMVVIGAPALVLEARVEKTRGASGAPGSRGGMGGGGAGGAGGGGGGGGGAGGGGGGGGGG